MAFEQDDRLQEGVLRAFVEAALRGERTAALPHAWHWVPPREMGLHHGPDEDRTFEKVRSARRVRERSLIAYKARLSAGERPVFARPCDRARAKLWHAAAAALGVTL
jgi:hypothetical protein